MFWRRQFLSQRFILTLGLFLICTLHLMIFAIFQIPENFLMGRDAPSLLVACKVILYSFAIGTSLAHQFLCRRFGLRKALYFGLLCNLFGISTLLLNQYLSEVHGMIALVVLDMVFFGMALTSVVNALVTYIIIEFPKKVGLGIVALFAFGNLGYMLAPLMMEGIDVLQFKQLMYFLLIALLLLSIWFVHVVFFDPEIPSERIQLKKEGLIWRRLHYRLALFVVAIISYSLAETTFNLWGYVKIAKLFGTQVANETTPVFWLFLIIGQLLLLIPLYFFPARRIFYFLVIVLAVASFYLPMQESVSGFVLWLAIAGFGCSAVFPILLSQMEKEVLSFASGNRVLPYIEKSISLMIGGYFAGVGIIDLWVQLFGHHHYFTIVTHFHFAAGFIGITGLIALFLNLSRSAAQK